MKFVILFFFMIQGAMAQNATQPAPVLPGPIQQANFTDVKNIKTGLPFSLSGYQSQSSFIVFYVSTDCDHCQHEMALLDANYELFKNYNILIISHAGFDDLRYFMAAYPHLSASPKVTVLADLRFYAYDYFHITSVPRSFIYDSAKKLIGNYTGGGHLEEIANLLQ